MKVHCTKCDWSGEISEDEEQKCPICGSTDLIEDDADPGDDYMADAE